MIPLFLDNVLKKRLDKIQLKGVEFNIKIIIISWHEKCTENDNGN